MWNFIKQNWGNLASVAGLIISVFTLLFAKRASQAAREAKAAVWRRTVADDLEEAERLASEMISSIRKKDWLISRYIANKLRQQAIWINERWASLLGEEVKDKVSTTKRKLGVLIEKLDQIADNNLSDDQIKKLVGDAEAIQNMFLEGRAKFSARTD